MIETITIDTDQWAVVPMVPTDAMFYACVKDGQEYYLKEIKETASRYWVAMLAAAPRPEIDEPRPVPTPIPTSERLPTEADADPWGNVLAFSKIWDVWSFAHWGTIAKYGNTIWLPTGLVRPAEPVTQRKWTGPGELERSGYIDSAEPDGGAV